LKPSFFIIGAPRCGTTALYEYLNSHPALFLPTLKEPHYFSEDLPGVRSVSSERDYFGLFASAGSQVVRAGEASVYYLSSAVAVPNILKYDARSRFIVLVRNPVEMLQSLHAMFCYAFYEDRRNCEAAWELQAERRAGRSIPALCDEPALLQYENICRFGSQVERLLAQVGRDQVKIAVFDDLVSTPKSVYEDVLAFLGIPTDGKTSFPRINARQQYRVAWVARALQSPPGLQRLRARLRHEYYVKQSWLGKLAYGTALKLKSYNSKAPRPAEMPAAFRDRLAKVLRPEVERIEQILGRDLGHWYGAAKKRRAA
jgi:hypothetical protein